MGALRGKGLITSGAAVDDKSCSELIVVFRVYCGIANPQAACAAASILSDCPSLPGTIASEAWSGLIASASAARNTSIAQTACTGIFGSLHDRLDGCIESQPRHQKVYRAWTVWPGRVGRVAWSDSTPEEPMHVLFDTAVLILAKRHVCTRSAACRATNDCATVVAMASSGTQPDGGQGIQTHKRWCRIVILSPPGEASSHISALGTVAIEATPAGIISSRLWS